MKSTPESNVFPYSDENAKAVALNLLSSTESEKLFIAMSNDEQMPVPFYILWFIKMMEQFIEANDEKGLSVMIHSLYESLETDVPDILAEIEQNGLLSQYAGELIEDLSEIADEEFSTDDDDD